MTPRFECTFRVHTHKQQFADNQKQRHIIIDLRQTILWLYFYAYIYICLCIYMYAYAYTYMPMHIYIYMPMYIHICLCIYIYAYAYTYMPIIEKFFKFWYNSSSSLIVDMFRPSGTPQYNLKFPKIVCTLIMPAEF